MAFIQTGGPSCREEENSHELVRSSVHGSKKGTDAHLTFHFCYLLAYGVISSQDAVADNEDCENV